MACLLYERHRMALTTKGTMNESERLRRIGARCGVGVVGLAALTVVLTRLHFRSALHGGRLGDSANPEYGATFRVALPVTL